MEDERGKGRPRLSCSFPQVGGVRSGRATPHQPQGYRGNHCGRGGRGVLESSGERESVCLEFDPKHLLEPTPHRDFKTQCKPHVNRPLLGL